MKVVSVVWSDNPRAGEVRVSHGRLCSLSIAQGDGTAEGAAFSFTSAGRLNISIDDENVGLSKYPTMVTVAAEAATFTFLLRDVQADYPLWIPVYQVIVTTPEDLRRYAQIAEEIRARGLQTQLQRIASEPEESYEHSAAVTRALQSPTWLGVSRDMRNFELVSWREKPQFTISAHYHGGGVTLEGIDPASQLTSYQFLHGRGGACIEWITERRLEEGVLPILRQTIEDGEVHYHVTAFATLERSPLTGATLRGTHYLVANGYGYGAMLTEAQRKEFDALLPQETAREEETVLYYRAEAVNCGQVPRYAWFQAPTAAGAKDTFDATRGARVCEDGRLRSLNFINGQPLPKEEVACLLKPGETATFEVRIPHQPIRSRAPTPSPPKISGNGIRNVAPSGAPSSTAAATFSVPEPRLQEMMQAGLLHLDIASYGLEPDGSVAATIGGYNPIGSESSPSSSTSTPSAGTTSPGVRSTSFSICSTTTASCKTSATICSKPAPPSGPWASTSAIPATSTG